MADPINISFAETDLSNVKNLEGVLVVFVDAEGRMDAGARRVNSACRRAISRFVESDAFEGAPEGTVSPLAFPTGVAATGVLVVKLARNAKQLAVRKAGAALAKSHGPQDMTIFAGGLKRVEELAQGLALRAYAFETHKTADPKAVGDVTIQVSKPEALADAKVAIDALVSGVFMTRDLTSEPANVLTTEEFANRLSSMSDLGLKVEVLDESDLEKLGMGALLCVGQGSKSPSKVVVMQWNGGGKEPPFALVGKGVVFDTGDGRHQPQDRWRHGRNDDGYGWRGCCCRCHAQPCHAKGQSERCWAGRTGGKHALRRSNAPRRCGDLDEGRHD